MPLRQSLEAYRDVVERASVTQERSARLVQAAQPRRPAGGD